MIVLATASRVSAPALAARKNPPFNGACNPRYEMAMRLPRFLQPFLTWLTAVPAPGERQSDKSPNMTLLYASARMGFGVLISLLAITQDNVFLSIFLFTAGVTITTSGMGIVQVVVFHYCAHGSMFKNRYANFAIGRAISPIFIFNDFDKYRDEHLQHHRVEKLITEEDEFSKFIVGVCRMKPGEKKSKLWARTLIALFSPIFHVRFFAVRVRGCCFSGKVRQAVFFGLFWGSLIWCSLYFGVWADFLLLWVLPLTVILQAATVFRILCEHKVPDEEVLAKRGKLLLCHATTGVFPGRPPPSQPASSMRGAIRWILWWLDLVTVQLYCRIFVLVGDAPCHDFHHRRPGSRYWPNAHHARQQDKANGCPGYPVNYIDVWGMFTAIDRNLEALANAGEDVLARISQTGHGLRRAEAADPPGKGAKAMLAHR